MATGQWGGRNSPSPVGGSADFGQDLPHSDICTVSVDANRIVKNLLLKRDLIVQPKVRNCTFTQSRLGVNLSPGFTEFPPNSSPELTRRASLDLKIAECPLKPKVWDILLKNPDFPPDSRIFLVRSIEEGVPLGDYEVFRDFVSPEREYEPAEQVKIHGEYLRELSLKRIAGPFISLPHLLSQTQIQLFPTLFRYYHFAIPKKWTDLSKPQKWRLISHLTFPYLRSPNDRIDSTEFPVLFPTYRTGI